MVQTVQVERHMSKKLVETAQVVLEVLREGKNPISDPRLITESKWWRLVGDALRLLECAGLARYDVARGRIAPMSKHQHTVDCYAKNATGVLAYTPCREDGLDRNARNLNLVDFEAGLGLRGLTLICGEGSSPEDKDA